MPISGGGNENEDTIGFLGDNTRAIFGRSYAAEPDILVKQLAKDEAIAEADTLLLTVPNQLGVDYNAHVIEAILKHVAPAPRLALTSASLRNLAASAEPRRNTPKRAKKVDSNPGQDPFTYLPHVDVANEMILRKQWLSGRRV